MAKQEVALRPIGQPRKIDLAEEMELAGVVVPQDVADAIPAEQPVFLPYQQRWFEDESQIMIGEKWGEIAPYRADLGGSRSQRGKGSQAAP